LFVAVEAERDGHEFVDAARAAGAAAALTTRPVPDSSVVVVDDTTAALARLGRWARDHLPDRVVGITGSVGKTSSKDLLAAVLAERYHTSASVRSFNNELGVPLTLFNAPDEVEAVVVEMGARGIDHIAELCRTARPTVGVVTTVGIAHTELFGSLADVVRAKGELVEALPIGGTAVLNADVPEVAGMASRTDARVLTFGHGPADIRATQVELDHELRAAFTLHSPWGEVRVRLGVRGEHQVANALAAAGAALALEAGLDHVAEGLERGELSPWRMELTVSPSGVLVLNDAYNANPTSTAAAIESLVRLDAERRVAVLGPMAELGDHTVDEHQRIAALAERLGVRVIAVDAPDYGPWGEHVGDLDEAFDRLGRLVRGDAVLVKGSRVAGLERLAARLLS
jgi:UDP-N-acetylmuramoyl-tripeptide--D-alanyl-D-alanine ligase